MGRSTRSPVSEVKLILVIAAGGAFGAVARHFVNVQAVALFGTSFPWGTLAVNFAGSFLMGVMVETSALVWSPNPLLRAMLTVGALGAFTTFSTFSLEVALLYERGQMELAALYIVASVVLAVGGLFAALALMRAVLL
jgi:CrcB protein